MTEGKKPVSEAQNDAAGAGVVDDDARADALEAAKQKRRTKLWQLFFIVLLIVFVGFLALGLRRTNVSEQRASGAAPAFEFISFEGETISLDDLAGQGVVLNLWASWC